MMRFNEDYISKIRGAIQNKDQELACQMLSGLHPADIAELYDLVSFEDAKYIFTILDPETAADVLAELDDDERLKLLQHVPKEIIAHHVIENMDSDDAVDLMRDLDEQEQEEILSHLKDMEQAGDIVDLLKYDEGSAGGLMGTEMIVVNENWSMPQCISEMRNQAEEVEEIFVVYVVDDNQRLVGIFPLKSMITSPSVSKVRKVMNPEPISVKTDTSIEEVAKDFEKYDLIAMPVVDSIGRLVGRITVDDVLDKVREINEREYQLASGISQDVESSDTILTQTSARLPWLLIGMIGGLSNSIILENYETGFASNPALALFIPLIGGTGGNVGIQSSALVVQGLANGSLSLKTSGKQLFKEAGVGLINASIISVLVYLYNWIRGGADNLSFAVSLSLFAVVMFASIFGTLVPLTLERLKIDPAIATGPFITITNDIIGMMIYMSITTALS